MQRYALDGWNLAKQGGVGTEGWDVWADLDGSSSLVTRYLRGDVVDQVFARIEEGSPDSIYWLLTDRMGSVRDIVDNTTTALVKDHLDYGGYGNFLGSSTNNGFRGRYLWTGREYDVETELQYNRARYYDSATGRWTSEDPLGFDAGDSNLYRYALNNPIVATDPSGLLADAFRDIPGWKTVEPELRKLTFQELLVKSDAVALEKSIKDLAEGSKVWLKELLDVEQGAEVLYMQYKARELMLKQVKAPIVIEYSKSQGTARLSRF